tara:strand:+ start:1261 stop:1911 length:651 start_codon:yes stop_codon:yes gene_type:complete
MPYPSQHENFYKNRIVQLHYELEHLTEIYNNRLLSEGILDRIIGGAAGAVEKAAARVGQRFPTAAAEAAAAAAAAANAWRALVRPISNMARAKSGPELAAWLQSLSSVERQAYNHMYTEGREFVHNGQTYFQRMFQGRVETWDSVNNRWSFDLTDSFGFNKATGQTPSAFGGLNAGGRPNYIRPYVESPAVDLTDVPYLGMPSRPGNNQSFPNPGY